MTDEDISLLTFRTFSTDFISKLANTSLFSPNGILNLNSFMDSTLLFQVSRQIISRSPPYFFNADSSELAFFEIISETNFFIVWYVTQSVVLFRSCLERCIGLLTIYDSAGRFCSNSSDSFYPKKLAWYMAGESRKFRTLDFTKIL